MDEPEPMPAFTFNPDGPTTITHPDGTVSVNAPRLDDTTATTATASGRPVTATPGDDTSTAATPLESPDPQPAVTFSVPGPSAGTATPGTSTTASDMAVPADAPVMNQRPAWPVTAAADAASNAVVNPDGSITMQLPDGSTQTVVRLPGGATIVTSTTQPGWYSQPAPANTRRPRRGRGR